MTVDNIRESKKNHFLFVLYYFVVFFGAAIQGAFLNLYLNNAGMSSTTISIINGCVAIMGLYTMPFWGKLADRAKSRNAVLILTMVLSTVLLVFFSMAKSLVLLGIMMVLFSAVHNPMNGLYESITVDYSRKYNWKYSPIRMSGTIGFAVMSVIAGFWLSKNQSLLFPIYIGSMALSTVIGCLLPKSKGVGSEKKKADKGAVKEVYAMLKDRRTLNILILFGIYMMTNNFNSVHYAIYLKQFCSVEKATLLSGIGHMIMALAEVPFHIGPGSRWLKKIGVEKSLCIVMATGVVRWAVCALCWNEWVLVITMAFNGIMLVPTIVGVVEYIFENSPEHLKATAQTTLRTPFSLVGSLISTFGFGTLVSVFNNAGLNGIKCIYWIMSPLCLIAGLLVFVPMVKRERAEKKSAEQK